MVNESFKDKVQRLPEIEMFFLIRALGGASDKNQTAYAKWMESIDRGITPKTSKVKWKMIEWEKDIQECRTMIFRATEALIRFDVKGTGAFDVWMAWWTEWCGTLPEEEFMYVISRHKQGFDISSFRPKGRWQDKMNAPAPKLGEEGMC